MRVPEGAVQNSRITSLTRELRFLSYMNMLSDSSGEPARGKEETGQLVSVVRLLF